MVTSWSRLKSNSMPYDSGTDRRYINPRARSSSVTASSAANTWTPVLEAISRVCCSAPRAVGDNATRHAAAMTNNTAQAIRSIMEARRVGLMSALYPIARPTAIGGVARNASNRELDDSKELMRGEEVRSAVRADLRCHHAFGARAEPYQNGLAGPQLRDAVAPQGLHVDEDVRRAFAKSKKPEASQAVEPLHDGAFQPACRCHGDMGARRRHLRRMDRRQIGR